MSVNHLGMDDTHVITSTEPLVSELFAHLRFARSTGSRRRSLSRRKGGDSNGKLISPQGQLADYHHHCANSAQSCFNANLEAVPSSNFSPEQVLSHGEFMSICGDDSRRLHQSDRDIKNDSIQSLGTAEFFDPMRRVQKEECYPWPAPKLFGTH